MVEIGFHALWAAEQELHEGCGLVKKTVACTASISAAQVRLKVLVEVPVRVALRRVGRQVEHLYLVRMRLHPGGHLLGMVRPEIVENEEDLVPFAVPYEPLHEAKGRLCRRGTIQKFESHQALAADGRDHGQTKALAGGCQHRRVSRWRIASYPMTILRHCGLVGPVNGAVFLLGLLRDQGVNPLHPVLHVPGLLLQGLTGGALRCVTPALQVLAYSADRHVDAKLDLDQVVHGPSVPQGKRQSSCRGRLRGQDRAQHPFLWPRQGAARQVGAPWFPENQTCLALLRIALRPAEHSGGVQAHHPGDLAPGQHQFLAQAYGLTAQGLEHIPGKLSSIDLFHD